MNNNVIVKGQKTAIKQLADSLRPLLNLDTGAGTVKSFSVTVNLTEESPFYWLGWLWLDNQQLIKLTWGYIEVFCKAAPLVAADMLKSTGASMISLVSDSEGIEYHVE